MKRRLFLGGALLVVGVVGAIEVVGCNGSFDICEGSACTGVNDGGSGDGQIIPPGCDLTKDPKDSAACVDDSIGIFVSANGSDSNAGTKASPLKSITGALAKVTSQHSRVYVCDGTYGEGVKVTAAVGIFGGFSCTDWSYDGTAGKVGPTGPGYALDIEGVSGGSGVTIEDLEFDAQNGANPGDSSIAIFVSSSTATLKRVKAVAGNGATGADAVATSNYDAGVVEAGSLTGNTPPDDNGAASCQNLCLDGTRSVGGNGGGGGAGGGAAGGDGGPSIPVNPAGFDGAGGPPKAGGCNTGDDGSNAQASDAGAAGASNSGTVSVTGWSTAAGAAGAGAGPGQGGGGGSGATNGVNKGGGGGGGCGGCGGAGGNGGNSGGSSFAVLIFQATVGFDTCVLQVGTGGDGRTGGPGQAGQTGGVGGTAIPLGSGGTGCNGATGGNGGPGAGGGGGAGGNAIAIGYVGTKPTVTGGTMTEGTAGAPGAGGAGAGGNDGLPGAAGTKADIQELP